VCELIRRQNETLAAWLAQNRKPLKRFLKIGPYCNPKLKLGENETFARGSKAYRTLVPTKLNSDPAANQNRRTERSDGSFTNLVTLIENVLNRCEDFQALTQTPRDHSIQCEIRAQAKQILIVVKL
jgi:hypothetical protein